MNVKQLREALAAYADEAYVSVVSTISQGSLACAARANEDVCYVFEVEQVTANNNDVVLVVEHNTMP